MDEHLRRLARAGAAGDPSAAEAHVRARLRAGTLGALGGPERGLLLSWSARHAGALAVGRTTEAPAAEAHTLNPFCLVLDPALRPLCSVALARRAWRLRDLEWGTPTCAECLAELQRIQGHGMSLDRLAQYQCGLHEPEDATAGLMNVLAALPTDVARGALEVLRGAWPYRRSSDP